MRYFLDTEFSERGPKEPIQLISIGIVAEDGRELYIESSECDYTSVNLWVKDNVIPHLKGDMMPLSEIALRIRAFCDSAYGRPEFWGYYADYDWVVFCQIFGAMIDLPNGWPMYCRDIKQLCDSVGNPKLPEQESAEHNALHDARWNRLAFEFLTSSHAAKVRELEQEIERMKQELAQPWKHSEHWRNSETGQVECECCCGWALDAERDHKTLASATRRAEIAERVQSFWNQQGEWSQATFGSDAERNHVGPLKHLEKEAREAYEESDANKLQIEIADCLFLTFDSARRAGMTLPELLDVAFAKLEVNKQRQWQKAEIGQPVEHVRTAREQEQR